MKSLRHLLFIMLISFLGGNQLIAQDSNTPKDTIDLMNGKLLISKVTLVRSDHLKYLHPKSNKETQLEWDRVFAVRYADGSEKIMYRKDEKLGTIYTVEEARRFVIGQRDAWKGFRAPVPLIIGGLIGVGAGLTGSPIGIAAPFVYMPLTLIPKVRVKKSTISNPIMVQYDTYVLGYERIARKKKVLNSLISGAIGLGIGYSLNALLIAD